MEDLLNNQINGHPIGLCGNWKCDIKLKRNFLIKSLKISEII